MIIMIMKCSHPCQIYRKIMIVIIFCSERDSGIGGITIGPVARSRGSNGDMIIGNHDEKDGDGDHR